MLFESIQIGKVGVKVGVNPKGWCQPKRLVSTQKVGVNPKGCVDTNFEILWRFVFFFPGANGFQSFKKPGNEQEGDGVE